MNNPSLPSESEITLPKMLATGVAVCERVKSAQLSAFFCRRSIPQILSFSLTKEEELTDETDEKKTAEPHQDHAFGRLSLLEKKERI